MDAQDLAITALRVLSAWTRGNRTESEGVKILRAHALLPAEMDLPIDELATRIIGRACAIVLQESAQERKEAFRLLP